MEPEVRTGLGTNDLKVKVERKQRRGFDVQLKSIHELSVFCISVERLSMRSLIVGVI